MARDSRLTKRQLKKLAKEQTGIVKKDPNNLVARLKLAGTLKEMGKNEKAVSHYREVAKVYASTGKLVQAISVYKGILEIDPGNEKTEAELSDLSDKRAKEIKAKSVPHLQQQDDGQWEMPMESDVSEKGGTDPGFSAGKVVSASPSVLRLPAPMPTDATASRGRRRRRSRTRLPSAPGKPGTSSTPSFEGLDLDLTPEADGVPSRPEGFDSSLPSLADHEAEVVTESSDSLAFDGDGDVTAERDLSAEAAAAVSHPDLMDNQHILNPDMVPTVDTFPANEQNDPKDQSFLADDAEEPTSPGPSGYKATIRESAVSIDMDVLLPDLDKLPPRPTASMRQTLVGVPTPEVPDGPMVDNKKTVQMEREPDMSAPPVPTDETLSNVFDDEEEAFWSEFSDPEAKSSTAEVAAEAKPTTPPRPTLLSTPVKAPNTSQPSTPTSPRPQKGKRARKSSKMTIPMGAAAFKKAVADQESPPHGPFVQQPGQTAGEVQLEEIALFRDLSETSREMLQSRIVRRTEKTGKDLVCEGDPGNALFVVSSGQVRVTKRDRQGDNLSLATLGPGAFFGEFALLSDRKRHATVTVIEDGVFFEISRKVIADLTKSDPAFGNTLRQFYRRRLLGTLIRSAPFFDPLSADEQEALLGRLRFRRIPEKTKIITDGEPGGGFFLILIGEVQVTKAQPDGSTKVLSTLSDGSYFGEMSLLKGGNAVATVTTVTPTEIVQLAAAEFYRILSKYPQIWEEVNREAKRRELANLQILSGHAPEIQASDDSVVV